jgi:hypothetical protein
VVKLEFNNEIIDGQSTVAENLAKSNRNFMLLKEILGSGATSQDIQSMLNTISQTYVKTADIVNSLNSTDTNKPVSALQAKNLKQDITNLTGQLQQLNQNVNALTQSLNQNISNLTQRLDNKVEKTDKNIYKYLQSITQQNVDILKHAENLKATGTFQLYYNNANTPTGNWDWCFADVWYFNDNTVRLQITKILPPYTIAKNNKINGNWSGWTVI